ncbi:MAG: 30S ribosomal protein S8e [Candidatus Heimdallarchaeota archaeon]
MVKWQGRSRRKSSGRRYRAYRKKRKYELGRPPTETLIGPVKKKIIRTMGGNRKIRLQRTEEVNIFDPTKGTTRNVKVLDVLDNEANKDFTRRKVITRGALIETELGRARVTSRPGQHGIINAVLLKE